MSRQFTIDPVARIRVIADNVEQMAREVRRAVAAAEWIVDDLKRFYGVVSPLIKRLRAAVALS